MREQLLEHFNERKADIDMLVLHSTAFCGEDVGKCLDELKLSCHYVIDVNGDIIKLVDEKKRAYHAGEAFWRGSDEDFNSRSIGIEICNLSLGQTPFSEVQMAKLVPFCQKLIRKYKIKPENVVGHSDIAPNRKPDPGLAFPWKTLAREGIGFWYEPKNALKMPENDVAKLLDIIGYDTRTNEATIASSYAFRRRFLPKEVEVIDDVNVLVNNVYPTGKQELLKGDKFLQTLKAVAYAYSKA